MALLVPTPTPSEICGFSLEKMLNCGHSGKVFWGHHLESEQPVVVKLVKKMTSWTVETNALPHLDHPNIVKMVGTHESNVHRSRKQTFKKRDLKNYNIHSYTAGTNFHLDSCDFQVVTEREDTVDAVAVVHVLAQEFAANGDFYTLLMHHDSFPENVARTLVKPVVQALDYAYKQGISHRDIKLENIFITEGGVVKVGDWGLCGFQTRGRLCSSSVGTLGYMAPELLCRERYNANKTDVWAVGVLLFSICTGVRPYGEPKQRKKHNGDDLWRDTWLSLMLNGKWKEWWWMHMHAAEHIKNLSKDLKDLFENMLAEQEKRATLEHVLDHPWMKGPVVENHEIVSLCHARLV